ncbi:hypothetical protein DFP72DRAFT_877319 [Ephemerocybe angulata]|uniref:Uncharacterized protein n=1 Tax=Ephemerocybe angulata TaxID=980116 RepID=A0A8H6IAF8_9AGAR|nr:hypothetical protein DFP72DRAFT_877319 [Tulosesus angulatus]
MESSTGPPGNHFPVQVGASRFADAAEPHFISNLEGAILEASSLDLPVMPATSRKFTGDRNQQWLLQAESNGSGRVAVASMHDGRYLMDRGSTSSISTEAVTSTTPFYWTLTEVKHGVYILSTPAGHRKLTIPTSVGESCMSRELDDDEDPNIFGRILILPSTTEVQNNLRSGAIGCYAYPDQEIYYSVGVPDQIIIMNHLSTLIYAAVSGAKGSTAQWPIEPEDGTQYWKVRSEDESAHVSRPGSIEGQGARVYRARSGMILHIQKMPWKHSWQGIQSVSVDAATYTSTPKLPNKIGIKNETAFDIHACVHSTIQGRGDTRQYSMKPNVTESWERTSPETVFVSVGSTPGVPRAYLGRPGFVLSITASE